MNPTTITEHCTFTATTTTYHSSWVHMEKIHVEKHKYNGLGIHDPKSRKWHIIYW